MVERDGNGCVIPRHQCGIRSRSSLIVEATSTVVPGGRNLLFDDAAQDLRSGSVSGDWTMLRGQSLRAAYDVHLGGIKRHLRHQVSHDNSPSTIAKNPYTWLVC
jgi:hypothetical protein